MYLKNLEIKKFRNIKNVNLEFCKGVNIFLGKNAQGKTNLLESIYLLSGNKSFRGALDRDFIPFEDENYFISGSFGGESEENIKIAALNSNGEFKKKVVKGDKVYKTSRILLTTVPMTVFSPEDLEIVKSGPSVRRDFCDELIKNLFFSYSTTLSRYTRMLAHKNKLLKEGAKEDLFDIWNMQLSAYGASIVKSRVELLKRLVPYAQKCFFDMAGESEVISFDYQCCFCEDTSVSEEIIKECLYNKFKENLYKEIEAKKCLYGPHRDDVLIKINGKDARSFASQGQQRSAVLSLILAKTELMKSSYGKTPIILLDDVMSELDDMRRSYLLDKIEGFQVFITCCQDELAKSFAEKKVFKIRGGETEE